MRFTKKPVEIEAWPVAQIVEQMKHYENGLPAPVRTEWRAGRVQRIIDGLIIHTLEGAMNADPDDWLIRGIQGELYPCKPDIFEATYGPVSEDSEALSGEAERGFWCRTHRRLMPEWDKRLPEDCGAYYNDPRRAPCQFNKATLCIQGDPE